MIMGFGAKNFFSFKDGFDVSFIFGNGCPEEITHGKDVSNLLCIKGANGSGKTNILRALNFVVGFITDSFSYKPDSVMDFDPFFSSEEDTHLYLDFNIGETLYRYEVTLTELEVKEERLFRKVKREVVVFERMGNKITYAISEFSALKTIPKLRNNVSVISLAKQFGMECVAEIHNDLSTVYTNVRYQGLVSNIFDFKYLNKFLHDSDSYRDFVKEMVCKFDPSIQDIFIRETNGDSGEESKIYTPWFVFKNNNKTEILSYAVQSSGTKSLYNQLASYKAVLKLGGLLVLDEFDINLHPHILPHLLDIFTDNELNPHNGQLIFTTHNTEILDYLGKHRTYLVNKEGNESYCYRLDEISSDILRNDRSISPAYNQGKIGGVPNL